MLHRASRVAFLAAAVHGAEVDDIVQNDDCYMKLERDGASCHAGLADSITSQFGGGAMVRAQRRSSHCAPRSALPPSPLPFSPLLLHV